MINENSFKFKDTLSVPFYQCDSQGRWKPASFFQAIATNAANDCERLGSGPKAMLDYGYFWVFSRMKIKFIRYPKVNDIITVQTWPRWIQQKLFYIREFEVLDQLGEILALATSAWLVVNVKSRRLVPPERVEGMTMPSHPETFALDESLDKLKLPENGTERFSRTARYSAIDINGHTNNSRYIEAICDSFDVETFQKYEMDWMQINYDNEVRANEVLAVNMVELPEQELYYGFTGINQSNQTRAFDAVVKLRPNSES